MCDRWRRASVDPSLKIGDVNYVDLATTRLRTATMRLFGDCLSRQAKYPEGETIFLSQCLWPDPG